MKIIFLNQHQFFFSSFQQKKCLLIFIRKENKQNYLFSMIEWFRGHIERLNLQAGVLRYWHKVVAGCCTVALILQVVGWIIASQKFKLFGRHVVGIFGFIFTIICLILNWYSLTSEPQMIVMFTLQLLSLVTLFLVSSSGGALAIVVDVCHFTEETERISCGATVMEYLASWVVCVCLCLIFGAAQKKIIMLVDKGILNGIGNRLSRIE